MKLNSCRQYAEAFVLIKEEKMRLRYLPNAGKSIELRSHSDEQHPDRIVYVEGIDYVIDLENGYIRRTKESLIPDWSSHVLYNIPNFDHTLFADCSNREFTVFLDYYYELTEQSQEDQSKKRRESQGGLEQWTSKLRAGEGTLFVVIGDSISAGGEASEAKYTFSQRFTNHINGLYPESQTSLINKAIGGETSDDGRKRFSKDVLSFQPDLVSIGYGMNDQNKYKEGVGVSLEDYERNLREMIKAAQQLEDCDIVLVTPCLPNPLWWHTSGLIDEYAEVIRRLGSEYRVSIADVHEVWQQELAAGKTPESLLLNNINHPNDYGHELYFKAFLNLLECDTP